MLQQIEILVLLYRETRYGLAKLVVLHVALEIQ